MRRDMDTDKAMPLEPDVKPGLCRFCWNAPIHDTEDDACKEGAAAVASLYSDHLGAIAGMVDEVTA